MLSIMNKHPLDNFVPYTQRKMYKACTSWIKTFFNKFDPNSVIDEMMASPKWEQNKYYGMSKQDIMDMWKENGKISSVFGINIHKYIENYYNQKPNITTHTPIEVQYFHNFSNDHSYLIPYRTEFKIYHMELQLSGCVDMIYKNEEGNYDIYDWKITKDIKYHGYGKKGLGICNIFEDCNYTHYSLQLNIYKYILETKYNMKIDNIYIVVLHRDFSEDYVELKVPFLDMKEIIYVRKYQLSS